MKHIKQGFTTVICGNYSFCCFYYSTIRETALISHNIDIICRFYDSVRLSELN